MKTLKIREVYQTVDTEDVGKIVSLCENRGYVISELTAAEIWLAHCESRGASWLPLPQDGDRLLGIVLSYSTEVAA